MQHQHNKHEGHKARDFFIKFWVSLILTVPIVLYADVVESLFDWRAPVFAGAEYIPLVLGSIVYFYGGWVFLLGALQEIRSRLPGMMTLIGLATSAAYLWSVYAVFAGQEALFWELATLITIMLLGHWLEMRAVSGTQGALQELAKLIPDTAEVMRNNRTETVLVSELKVGDIVMVRPGARVPADGEIVEGESELNESIITGESRPSAKKEGDAVIAGSTNGDGTITVNIAKIGEHTFLAGVMRLVEEAQVSKSRLQILSDKAAYYLTIVAVGGGIITLGVWLIAGAEIGFAVARLVAVLVIACPHALGLAVPLVASISTTKAAQNGFLVKQRIALEAARNIDVVLFDKTGTLTQGGFGVTAYSSKDALALAASVDVRSEHPIARGIVAKAKELGLSLKDSENYRRIPGIGAEAAIDGKRVFVGHRGGDNIVVELNGQNVGTIDVEDTVRHQAKEAVQILKKSGIKVGMITGDSEKVAKEVSEKLALDEYFARVLPEEKVNKVKSLQEQGLKVAMVGDGINDAPALMQADLGIAVGAGTNVAIESAGIILVRNDPLDISKIINLSRLTYRKMIQNIFWATGYNVVALPLAAGILFSRGIILEPAIAAIFMTASTLIVAFNAMLLKRQPL